VVKTKPSHGRALKKCGHFLDEAAGAAGGTTIMDDSDRSADRIGRVASAIFLGLLVALFAYGYLAPLLAG
jgi:hypothetical protein